MLIPGDSSLTPQHVKCTDGLMASGQEGTQPGRGTQTQWVCAANKSLKPDPPVSCSSCLLLLLGQKSGMQPVLDALI
jgi:hypothetical protein